VPHSKSTEATGSNQNSENFNNKAQNNAKIAELESKSEQIPKLER
jgi:hypothetical protein